MAGKIFPTTDPGELAEYADWFTLANPAGGFVDHYLDSDLRNDIF
jgi:hypothetical protein